MRRTKLEQRVEALSDKLPGLTPRQREWVWHSLFENEIRATKGGNGWCTRCGEIFGCDIDQGVATCPKCGEKLPVIHSLKQTENKRYYFTVLATIDGLQVIRHFIAKKRVRKGLLLHNSCVEVCQIWLDDEGHKAINARSINGLSWYYDAWRMTTPLGIKRDYRYYQCANPYIIHSPIAPGGSVLRKIRRNGYTRKCDVIPVCELMRQLLIDNGIETLIKQRQYDVIRYLYNTHYGKYREIREILNICHRFGYNIRDAQLWYDYIELLKYFHKDTHSPHYVCPANLKQEHDRLYRKKMKIELEEIERRKAQAELKRNEEYRVKIAPYLGVILSGENLRARVLRSIEEFQQEGDKMNHCVYANEYDKKADTLIFSVRDNRGKRLATVEYNLQTMAIVQCRGKNNSQPRRYEEIIQLFNPKEIQRAV